MEVDKCSNHEDSKLPILDMKCWLNEKGEAVYIHYQKPMASKLVIPARSFHSNSSKRSVHISECLRRIQNTSQKLDWDEFVAPVLSEYMGRMMAAGYSENYRKHILQHSIAIWDNRVNNHVMGVCPLNRPSGYRMKERRKEKKQKKKSWATNGGYIAPIIVPATLNSELKDALVEIAEKTSDGKIRFKIVEKGGVTLERMLQKSNPTSSGFCGKEECDMCEGGRRSCHKKNIVYEYECDLDNYTYVGETSRNFYSRNIEHQEKFKKEKSDSFIHDHQQLMHHGQDPKMNVKVVRSFKDALSRQIYEGVKIRRAANVMNTKLEYYQQATYRMNREVNHG